MEEYNGQQAKKIFFDFGIFEIIAAAGFIILFASNFLSFAPIEERTWREIGVGFPVMIGSIFAVMMILNRKYFSSFFIGMFSAFFITHEIIICYDNKAVEMGRELGPEGWFRSVAMLFSDALNPEFGAFWAVAGVCLALVALIIGWVRTIYLDNLKAAQISVKTDSGEDSQVTSDPERDVEWLTEEDDFDSEWSDDEGDEDEVDEDKESDETPEE